ncbi:MAG: hypothetical protein M3R05_04445 [Chloroflexota bacterium]|nr:hypothetical protein [Chloroflexota bacterium]
MDIAAFASFAVLLIAWVAAPSGMVRRGTSPSPQASDVQPITGYQARPESVRSS